MFSRQYLKCSNGLLSHSKLCISHESSGRTKSAELGLLAGIKTQWTLSGAQTEVGTALVFISFFVTSLCKKLSVALPGQQTWLGAWPIVNYHISMYWKASFWISDINLICSISGHVPKFHSCNPILNSCWILFLWHIAWSLFHHMTIHCMTRGVNVQTLWWCAGLVHLQNLSSCKQTRTWHLNWLSAILITYFIATVFYYYVLYS